MGALTPGRSFLISNSSFDYLVEPVRSLLRESGIEEPTPPQALASPLILQGENVRIIAPTGSGKTEAAILPLLSRIVGKDQRRGISLLYITPLRALNRDMLRRLEVWCSKLGLTIDVARGDTPLAQRNKQSRSPPDLLVTTPETLQAILPGSRMRENLRMLDAVVVDEVHNLVESKRGVQLSVGLQRLRRVAGEFQLIGLSATVGSPQLAAGSLFGVRKDVGVHHGSLPREEREPVEFAFKKGEAKALVCTSTLELGIDVGSVDLVVQYMSPRQVTSLIQRVGRSGHRIGRTSEGVIIAVSADDVLESSASIAEAKLGKLEPTRPYRESLDVLAHHVAGY